MLRTSLLFLIVLFSEFSFAEGENYDSTHKVEPKAAAFIVISFIVFCAYVILRVRKELKKDTKSK